MTKEGFNTALNPSVTAVNNLQHTTDTYSRSAFPVAPAS